MTVPIIHSKGRMNIETFATLSETNSRFRVRKTLIKSKS